MHEVEWLAVLRSECEKVGSQRIVAERLHISPAVVNQALKGRYKGRLDKLEARVRGELMSATLVCPVLGPLSPRVCLDHQALPFAATNPLRVALYGACRSGCQHSEVKYERASGKSA